MAEPLPALSDESSADGAAAPVVVQRWKRFGHDRAYVHAGGIQLGYRNLKTSEIDCEKDEYLCTIDQATLHLLPPREVEPPEPAPDQGGICPAMPAVTSRQRQPSNSCRWQRQSPPQQDVHSQPNASQPCRYCLIGTWHRMRLAPRREFRPWLFGTRRRCGRCSPGWRA